MGDAYEVMEAMSRSKPGAADKDELAAWRASGLTPEQAQRLGALVLGGKCEPCEGNGRFFQHPDTFQCSACRGSGIVPGLAERLVEIIDTCIAVGVPNTAGFVDLILTELREALA